MNGVVLGSGVDTFTGLTYAALGNASAVVKANGEVTPDRLWAFQKMCDAIVKHIQTRSTSLCGTRSWYDSIAMAKKSKMPASQTAQSANRSWRIHFFQRHREDDPGQSVPARDYLDGCPVAARLIAVVKAVADAPPPAFSGGGKWETMHDEMAGYYEVRVDGPQRRHYRLFCVLERDGASIGLGGSSLVLITGMDKPFRTTFSDEDYARVRKLGDEYKRRSPRSVAK